MPHHASPWNTILFPLSRSPTRDSVGERVSLVYLCVFARVCAHAFCPLLPCTRAYVCINAVHLFPCVETMDLSHLPITTPLRHEQRNTNAHRYNHPPDTYPGHWRKPLLTHVLLILRNFTSQTIKIYYTVRCPNVFPISVCKNLFYDGITR